MPNMSYCRFENTYGDLKDCLDAILECESAEDCRDFLDDMSSYEKSAFERMRELCEQFIAAYDNVMDAVEEIA